MEGSLFPEMSRGDIIAAQAAHYLYPWAAQSAVATPPIVVDSGQGVRFWDMNGRGYLDVNSGLMNSNLGWNHPRVVAGICEATKRGWLFHSPQHGSAPRAMLVSKLAEIVPSGLARSFLCLAGADAVDNAIKMARHVTGRSIVISLHDSYHGSTGEARHASGDPRHNVHGATASGFLRVYGPHPYRCPFGYPDGAPDEVFLEHLRKTILHHGAKNVAAIIMETVTGSNGIIIRTPAYMQGLRALASEFGIKLILDEVMCGFGRTGKMFACEHYGIVPDFLVLAKGLTCGAVPLGAVMVRGDVAQFYDTNPLMNGLTYAGHPLACATAYATIDTYQKEGLIENSDTTGLLMSGMLRAMKDKHPCVGDVRSIGLFGVLELVKDRNTRKPLSPWNEPLSPVMKAISAKLLELGIYAYIRWGMLFVVPPLIITPEELGEAFDAIDKALELGDQAVTA